MQLFKVEKVRKILKCTKANNLKNLLHDRLFDLSDDESCGNQHDQKMCKNAS